MEQPMDSSLDLPLLSLSQDLSSLLTSNDVPLDSDIPVLRNIIFDGQKTLDTLEVIIQNLQSTVARLAAVGAWDAQIHSALVDLHATLAQLTEFCDATTKAVREYRAVLHPVRRVPQELICEIFMLVVLGECSERTPKSSRLTQPWYLGHICQSWRRAALSYPRLWPSVTFPWSDTCEGSAMVETQLSRSGNTPLDILWEDHKFVESRLLELVATHSNRWRILRLYSKQLLFGDSTSALNWLRPVDGRLVQLERLELVTVSDHLLVPDVFAAAPALREVVLTDRKFKTSSPMHVDIPWAQITHYRACYPPSRQLKILQKAPNLIECAIAHPLADSFFSHNDISHHVSLPQLRRLHSTDSMLLGYIDAPLLDTLSYVTLRGSNPLTRFCSKSLTRLIFIDFKTSAPSVFQVIALLRGLPTLTYLLLGAPFTALAQIKLFDVLALSGTASDICPHLTSFLYGYLPRDDIYGLSFPCDSLCTMVQSRFELRGTTAPDHLRSNPSRLGFLRIFHLAEPSVVAPHAIQAMLRMLKGMGLDAAFLPHRELEYLQSSDFI